MVDKVKADHPDNLCAKYLEKDYYASLSGADRDTFYKCVRTGIDNPDSGMGCYAMTPGGEGRAFEPAATLPPSPPPGPFPCPHLPLSSATLVEPPTPLLLLWQT